MRRIVRRFESSPSSRWPLFGALALGLVAGVAIGAYGSSQRAQLKRLSLFARRTRFGLIDMRDESEPAAVITVAPSNHRRKATAEV